jgi:hypothetical protein
MSGEMIIYCCGIYAVAFAIFHIMFWRIFNWKKDLQNISVANRAIIQIANSRLIYVFLFTAFVCFFYTDELLTTRLGHVFLAGSSIFWFGRTIEQFVFLGYKHKVVNLLTIIFIIGAILFAIPLFL